MMLVGGGIERIEMRPKSLICEMIPAGIAGIFLFLFLYPEAIGSLERASTSHFDPAELLLPESIPSIEFLEFFHLKVSDRWRRLSILNGKQLV